MPATALLGRPAEDAGSPGPSDFKWGWVEGLLISLGAVGARMLLYQGPIALTQNPSSASPSWVTVQARLASVVFLLSCLIFPQHLSIHFYPISRGHHAGRAKAQPGSEWHLIFRKGVSFCRKAA